MVTDRRFYWISVHNLEQMKKAKGFNSVESTILKRRGSHRCKPYVNSIQHCMEEKCPPEDPRRDILTFEKIDKGAPYVCISFRVRKAI